MAASTMPAPSPLSSTACWSEWVRTIGSGSDTGNLATAGASGNEPSLARWASSISGASGMATFGTPTPYMRGSPRPGMSRTRSHSERGRGVLYRSYWRSLRTTMSPTLISRATAARPRSGMVCSCRRRSSALSSSAEASEPWGISSRAA